MRNWAFSEAVYLDHLLLDHVINTVFIANLCGVLRDVRHGPGDESSAPFFSSVLFYEAIYLVKTVSCNYRKGPFEATIHVRSISVIT